jgi:protein ImuB
MTAGLPPDAPLAVAAAGKGGNRLVAVNAAAERFGLSAGMLLTDATAIAPDLRAVAQDVAAESAQLRRLALWCRRYTPWVAPEPPDGLRLDITGAAHLMGGEAALLRDLRQRFTHAGFACRAAAASTPAGAWAMARHGGGALSIIPEGEERARLSPLPVRALRIEEDKAAALERLGLKTIGHLLPMSRRALRARFGTALSICLDQAIGLDTEAQTSLAYEPVYQERLDFAEPVGTLEGVQVAAGMLAERLGTRLAGDGKGARRFTLTLYDTVGVSHDVGLTLAKASHVPTHILRLFRERLRAFERRFDQDVAFDAATMLASRVERIAPAQSELLSEDADQSHAGSLATLIDRLNARLGEGAVRRFAFRESHHPERAASTAPILRQAVATRPPAPQAPRPFLLLPRPEEVTAIAEMPDYPPRSFTWRRVQHKVVKAEGPERIAPEWWQSGELDAARHYYAVEDEGGRRFWLFREGAYAADGGGGFRWYLHGFLR